MARVANFVDDRHRSAMFLGYGRTPSPHQFDSHGRAHHRDGICDKGKEFTCSQTHLGELQRRSPLLDPDEESRLY